MKLPQVAGWKRMLGVVAAAAGFLAVLAWANDCDAAASQGPAAKQAAAPVPTKDTATETWRVHPPPAPPLAAPPVPRDHAEVLAPKLDWSALSVGLAEEPIAATIALAGPAELESGLSASEREQLIAAGEDREIRPVRSGRSVATAVVARGTPRGSGHGRCD